MSLADTEKQTLAKPDISSSSSSSSSTSSTSFDLNSQSCIKAAADRAERIYQGPIPEAQAYIIKNIDGSHGEKISRLSPITDRAMTSGTDMKMSGLTSLTKGSGMCNDKYKVVFSSPSDNRRIPEFVRAVLIQRFGEQIINLLGFEGTMDERYHEYPCTPGVNYTKASLTFGEMGATTTKTFKFHVPGPQESGRLHPHVDRAGTLCVIILNLGHSAEYGAFKIVHYNSCNYRYCDYIYLIPL